LKNVKLLQRMTQHTC